MLKRILAGLGMGLFVVGVSSAAIIDTNFYILHANGSGKTPIQEPSSGFQTYSEVLPVDAAEFDSVPYTAATDQDDPAILVESEVDNVDLAGLVIDPTGLEMDGVEINEPAPSPIPEPGTMLLLGGGLMGLAGYGRKRKK